MSLTITHEKIRNLPVKNEKYYLFQNGPRIFHSEMSECLCGFCHPVEIIRDSFFVLTDFGFDEYISDFVLLELQQNKLQFNEEDYWRRASTGFGLV